MFIFSALRIVLHCSQLQKELGEGDSKYGGMIFFRDEANKVHPMLLILLLSGTCLPQLVKSIARSQKLEFFVFLNG